MVFNKYILVVNLLSLYYTVMTLKIKKINDLKFLLSIIWNFLIFWLSDFELFSKKLLNHIFI